MSARARRFVHVFASFGAGGAPVRAVQLMHHLGAECEHVVMALDGNVEAGEMLRDDVKVQYAEPSQDRSFFGMRAKQVAWLREQKPDLVLTYNWGSIESVAAAKQLKLPIVHHEDGFGAEEASKRFLRRSWLRRWLLRGVPVIVPSSVLQQIASKEWRLRPQHLHLLANGVDLVHFSARTEGRGGEPAGQVVGTVGGLRAEKDHHNLLRALAIMPAAVTVCLVGSGPMEASLREQAKVGATHHASQRHAACPATHHLDQHTREKHAPKTRENSSQACRGERTSQFIAARVADPQLTGRRHLHTFKGHQLHHVPAA